MKQRHLTISIALAIGLLIGCSSSNDERLAHFALESTEQQAQQNQASSQLNREVAENQRRLVESVEQSRQDIVLLGHDLQQQRQQLDQERSSLANERYRESLLAPVLDKLGILLVTALPLIVCWYLLHGLRSNRDDDAISEVLIQDLVADRPVLLPPSERQPAIEHTPPTSDPDQEALPF